MRYIIGIMLLVIGSASLVFGQTREIGLPFINNFTPKQYNANTQNWAVVQDNRGVMYFGNNKGVLEYDGVNWRLIPVSNNSIVRSLAVNHEGTIFVGAVGEFGFLAPDETGNLKYNSLVNKEEDKESTFSDVWTTLVKDDEVYFQSYNTLFRYKNGKIRSWPLINSYHRSFVVYNKLYLRQDGIGLMVLENETLKEVKGGNIFAKEAVSAMLPYKENIIIGSRSQGLFLYNIKEGTISQFEANANDFLGKNQLYHGTILSNGNYVFSTVKNGFVVVDSTGETLIHLNHNTGLLNKTVYYVYPDLHGSLWLGMAHGISKVEIISPIHVFDKILGLDGGILAVIRFQGKLYVCTHQGTFYLNKHSHFEQVENIYSQCWYLEKFPVPSEPGKEKLLVASTAGVYDITTGEPSLIYQGRSGIVKTSRSNPSRIFIGFNGYIGSFLYKNGQWLEEGTLKIINDEFRSLQEDNDGNLWMGSMFAGVYRLKIQDWEEYISGKSSTILDSIRYYGIEDGLPTLNWNYFYRVNNELVVTTQKGIYRYNAAKDGFEKDAKIHKALKEQERWYYYLNEDEQGNLWFDSDKGKGILYKEGDGYTLSENPFKRIIVSPENQVTGYTDEDGIIWFGTPDGLYRYDSKQLKDYNQSFHVLIRKVIVGEDSTIFNGTYFEERKSSSLLKSSVTSFVQPKTLKQALDYDQNSISFHYSAPVYENESANQFSYFLEGYDQTWSSWTKEVKKEYTNLPEGNYIFKVRAKNFYDTISEESIYEFAVLPPWYRTPVAYGAFFLIIIGGINLFGKVYSNRLRKDNLRLEAIVQSRMAEISEQKERIERQKDEVERSYKDVTTLSQIGQSITSSLDLKSIINTLYKSINSLMNVSSFGVGIYNDQNQSIDFHYALEEGRELPSFSHKITCSDKMAVWCFNYRQEVFINNLKDEYSKYLPSLPVAPPVGDKYSESVIYIPLQVKDKTIGVITVQSFKKNVYQPYHLDILRTLAAYTAIALDNSNAYLRLNEINEELTSTLENLKQTQSQLVQSEKMASLGQLTAGVAHEINNPINFVSAGIDSLNANYEELNILLQKYSSLKADADNTELLQEVERLKKELDLEYLLKEIPQLLKSIKAGAHRTTEIVKSLRNFTRLDEDSLKKADIVEGLESSLVILRNQMSDRIEVIKEYDNLVPLVHCYPGQLNQVFMNILNNAIQAIDGPGKINIKTQLQKESVIIRIKDSGKGMSEETKQRIFEPFFTTKEVGEGTGLGLSISYSIIEKHKGKIEVESTLGKGTEFVIQLPLNLN